MEKIETDSDGVLFNYWGWRDQDGNVHCERFTSRDQIEEVRASGEPVRFVDPFEATNLTQATLKVTELTS